MHLCGGGTVESTAPALCLSLKILPKQPARLIRLSSLLFSQGYLVYIACCLKNINSNILLSFLVL